MQTLKIINDNIRKISETNTLLDMLLEFEGVLDTFDIYAYKNWKKGEVINGPKLGRYFIEVALMYPYEDMPDPEALLRLKANDCDVKMYKDQLIKSKKIKSVEDTEVVVRGNAPRRVAKKEKHDIWIVEVKMPRRFVDEFSTEQIEAAEDAYVDMEAIQSGVDQNLENPVNNADPMAQPVADPMAGTTPGVGL
tara:strand:+ start:8266 stop:8844 length:579 start_codon:yes stop_codon:yes gene_type:complete